MGNLNESRLFLQIQIGHITIDLSFFRLIWPIELHG